MLRLQKKGGTQDKVKEKKKKKKSARLVTKKSKSILEVTYSLLSNRMRSCLSLAASYSAGRKSIYRWPWSSKFGLTYRLKLGRTFLTWCEMFVTLTFFSQLGGYSPACQYQPFFSSSYSNMADGFCFPVYANTDLKGRSNRGLAKITMLSPSGGIREKP